jgi:hypothetical protein
MKNRKGALALVVAVLAMGAAFSWAGGNKDQTAAPASQTGSTATQTPAAQSAPSNPYFTGDGGRGKSITILPPKGSGLAQNQAYLPDFVANELVSNFNSFSAMTLFDRVNNQKQYDELLSGFYADTDKAGLDLGHLSSTDYMLLGTITKTTSGYALQLTINSNSDKTTAAAYSAAVSVAELDNLSGVRRASLDLLQKMGVQLTAQAQTELTEAATAGRVNAQTAMAQGIAAQRQGNTVETMARFYEAASIDPSLAEAVTRVNAMSSTIRTGRIGDNIRNDIAWRREWIKLFEDASAWSRANPPRYTAEFYYDPKLSEPRNINYQNETVDFIFQYGMRPFEISSLTPAWKIREDLKAGLKATGRSVWGIDPRDYDFQGNKPWNRAYVADFELLNDKGKIIATYYVPAEPSFSRLLRDGAQYYSDARRFNTLKIGEITVVGDYKGRAMYNSYLSTDGSTDGAANIYTAAAMQGWFNVKANDITDAMTIRVKTIYEFEPQPPNNPNPRQPRIRLLNAGPNIAPVKRGVFENGRWIDIN